MIIQYIRRTKTEVSPRKKVTMQRTHKIGVLVAWRDPIMGDIRIGWSALNLFSDDKFDAKTGIELAKKKSYSLTIAQVMKKPLKVEKELPAFIKRVEEHFNNPYFSKV